MDVPVCSDFFAAGACNTCMEGYCCAALAACYSDMNCLYGCLQGFWPLDPSCSQAPTSSLFQAVLSCQKQFCTPACNGADMCNPVSGSGCEAEGACDAVYPGVFACTEVTVPAATVCQTCNVEEGPFCGIGLHCHAASSKCAQFCCTDADCGTGTCVTDQTTAFGQPLAETKEQVGLCLTNEGTTPACDAPATPPSGGSCAPTYSVTAN